MAPKLIIVLSICVLIFGCGIRGESPPHHRGEESQLPGETSMSNKVIKSEKEWKQELTPEQFQVLRRSGTEHAFTGKYNDHTEKGLYVCAGCGTPLFTSDSKYDHGTGWPSFTTAVEKNNIRSLTDLSHQMQRTEVRCAVCDGHLGHVFADGPAPTYQHYCINSAALDFNPEAKPDESPSQDPKDKNPAAARSEETAVFAAGCFWGIEDKFRKLPGVLATRVGYTGGQTENPTYQQVCSDSTGHAEAVEVRFDPALISYSDLVSNFFEFHNPTQLNRQGPDFGSQYRSAIFYLNEEQKNDALSIRTKLVESERYKDPIATLIVPASEFYQAEEYHQKYYDKLYKKK